MNRTGLAALALTLAVGWFGSSPAQANKSSFVDFKGATYYTVVRFQQGRVQLDEDFNESFTLEISAMVDEALIDYVQFPDFPDIPLGILNHSGEQESTIFRFFTDDPHFRVAVSNPEGFPIEIIIPPHDDDKATILYFSTFTAVPMPGTLALLGSGLVGLLGLRKFYQI
jgi:hypothetical protein